MTEEAAPAGELSRFLARLADKHSDADAVFSLRLAETALDTLEREPPPVAALAVVGPTQTGKSTVVNIIAGGRYVETSPLAAHTQRASVLALNTSGEALPETYPMDPTLAPRTVESDAPACLIWDTPDFDSNASRVYRQQVARVCARVDLVVLVLSKEKYADQSVWTVLETLAPLEVPVVICLNKCDIEVDEEHSRGRSDADVLVPAIQRRLEEHPRLGGGIPVLILPLGAGWRVGILPGASGRTELPGGRLRPAPMPFQGGPSHRPGPAHANVLVHLGRAGGAGTGLPTGMEYADQRRGGVVPGQVSHRVHRACPPPRCRPQGDPRSARVARGPGAFRARSPRPDGC